MMRFWVFIILLCLPGGCSMLKNTSSATNRDQLKRTESEENKLQLNSHTLSDTDSFTFYNDSASRNYEVRLWPKGSFTYSPENGFTGEADRISISGHSADLKKGGEQKRAQKAEQSALDVHTIKQQKVNEEHVQKIKETSISWKWVVVITILLVAICSYLILNKFKS